MRLLCMKAVGVKFKVFVTDADVSSDDDVDGFVQLLQLTPALKINAANWTNILVRGIRNTEKTR